MYLYINTSESLTVAQDSSVCEKMNSSNKCVPTLACVGIVCTLKIGRCKKREREREAEREREREGEGEGEGEPNTIMPKDGWVVREL
jgi:hypothetical protein